MSDGPVPIPVALARVGAAEADAAEYAGAFPILDEGQLAKLRPYGVESEVAAGRVLFREGAINTDFFVVLAGEVEAVAHYGPGAEPVNVFFGPGQFVGVMNILSGEGAYVTATVTRPGRVLQLPLARLRELIGQEITLSEIVVRAFLLRHSLLMRLGTGPKLIGSRYNPETREILDFLARNRCEVTWLDVETDPRAEALLRNFGFTVADTPLMLVAGQPILRNPTLAEVAAVFGLPLSHQAREETHDLIVVGAGPGGLAAAVYGASEGLATVVVEAIAVGGQAGTSSRIENYLGFPAGLSGEELAARAALQAQKFRAELLVGVPVRALIDRGGVHGVELADGRTLTARAVVIATGARYRRLDLERLDRFEGAGVFYSATHIEAQSCSGAVAVVGAGNSAGQAAVFLASRGLTVHMVVRKSSLEATMSRYLIDQIGADPAIQLHFGAEVRSLHGGSRVEGVVVEESDGSRVEIPVTGLYSFIGAEPNTDWLGAEIERDQHGFVVTGLDLAQAGRGWTPLPLESSRPSVFCVGDARHGSIKRVAIAVGEGAMAVRLVHDRLASPAQAAAQPLATNPVR